MSKTLLCKEGYLIPKTDKGSKDYLLKHAKYQEIIDNVNSLFNENLKKIYSNSIKRAYNEKLKKSSCWSFILANFDFDF